MRGLSALAILGGHWRRPGGGLSILSMPELDEIAGEPRSISLPGNPRSLDIARLGEILESGCAAGEGPHGVVGQSGSDPDRRRRA